MAASDEDDDFGDELVYDSELDETLRAAETLPDIEDVVSPPPEALAPFDEFRKRGYLSVSDLVATVWCEVQFDYRLRTLPFLPVSRRPKTITSTKGTSIAVDQVKVEGKERILKRGETIHKRLEREIHPAEVKVVALSREDAWGLRMLNMFSALEALLSLGKCRELPVAGFVDDVLVLGIIDEITREPVAESPTKGRQTRARRAESGRQASLNDFFGGKPLPQPQTHRLLVSDSKTRASGSMPREEDTLAGRLQVMLYKELVDALLLPPSPVPPPAQRPNIVVAARSDSPVQVAEGDSSQSSVPDAEPSDPKCFLPTASSTGTGLWRVWEHLGLDPSAQFSDEFIAQSRPVVESNSLRFGVKDGRTLAAFAQSWSQYVAALGLGEDGRTDNTLSLVYRRAAPKRKKEAARKRRKGDKKKKGRKGKSKQEAGEDANKVEVAPALPVHGDIDVTQLDEETQLQLALQLSLQGAQAQSQTASPSGGDGRPIVVDSATDTPEEGEPTSAESLGVTASATGGEERSSVPPTASDVAAILEESTTSIPQAEGATTTDAQAGSPNLENSDPSTSALPATASIVDNLLSSSHISTPPGRTPSYTQRSVSNGTKYFTSDSEQEREDAELAWAVEMSLNAGAEQDPIPAVSGVGVLSSPVAAPPPRRSRSRSPSPEPGGGGTASGSIIGRHRFAHDPTALAEHLQSVLQYWRGTREPHGVSLENARRCQWCEFEEGCEWREAKAQEALERYRSQRM